MHATSASTSRSSVRRTLVSASFVLLCFAGTQIPVAAAHAAPADAVMVVRPSWDHCSTPGVPC